jgi:tRNA 2-thiouridine synthesizing protein A
MDREIDIDIDAIGLKCPLPVLRLQKNLAALHPGQIARLRASDPMAAIDVPHFCAETGHTLLDTKTTADAQEFLVKKRA